MIHVGRAVVAPATVERIGAVSDRRASNPIPQPEEALNPVARSLIRTCAPAFVAVLAIVNSEPRRPALSSPLAPDAPPPAGALAWSQLPADDTLAGHDAIVTPDGFMLVHAGERQPGIAPAAMRQLDLRGPVGAWSTLATSGEAPIARLPNRGLPGSRAVVDPVEGVLLTVCDCREGNTFVLDLATGVWSHAAGDAPLPLWYSLLAYDAADDRAIVFGGQAFGLGDQAVASGWAYDLSGRRAGWRPLPDAPFKSVYQAAAVEPASRHLVAFGGLGDDGLPVGALWRLDLERAEAQGAWEDITALAGPGPAPRMGATLVFDPDARLGVLHGGYTAERDFGDVWLLDYRDPAAPRWVSAQPDGSDPGARSGHSAVWDPAHGRMVVYGGTRRGPDGDVAFLGDAWALSVAPPETARPTIHLPALFNAADVPSTGR
ncbi:hypothetical protein DCC79_10145 [bacterium]|nr:hypothetical protein [Chloroflexi bacterium CFX6]RIL09727.1 MAG: hypothetical protein DCC79_10145 [bacterium]